MSSLYYVGLCFFHSIYINLRQFCSSTTYMVVHKLLNLQQYTTFKKCIAKILSFTHTLNTQHRLSFEEITTNQITTNFVIGLRSKMEVAAASKSGLSSQRERNFKYTSIITQTKSRIILHNIHDLYTTFMGLFHSPQMKMFAEFTTQTPCTKSGKNQVLCSLQRSGTTQQKICNFFYLHVVDEIVSL